MAQHLHLKAEQGPFQGNALRVLFCLDVTDSVIAAAFGVLLVDLLGLSLLPLGGSLTHV